MAKDYKKEAMVVVLKVSRWTALVTDKAVSEDTKTRYNADHTAGSFKKKLIPGNDPDMKAIGSAANQIRTYHKSMTLPWDKSGRDLLPAKAFLKYKQRMTELEANFDLAVSAFMSAYAQKIEDAKVRLGSMFESSDFPLPHELKAMYGVDVHIEPLPDGENLKVGISQEELDKAKEAIERDVTTKVKGAHKALYQRLGEVAGKVVEALKADEPTFKKATLQNVLEMCDITPMLDIEGDEELQHTAKKLKDTIENAGFHKLKEDKEHRARVKDSVADELEKINRAVSEMA